MVEAASGYDAVASALAVITGDGSKLPSPDAEGTFNLVWFNWTDYKNPSDDPYHEVIKVITLLGDILTHVHRAQEGTAATAKNLAGKTYKLLLTITKESYDAIVPGWHGVISPHNDGNIEPEGMGTNAVDFQFTRLNALQTSRGDNSFIAGGMYNTASGGGSFAANEGNIADGQSSAAFGQANAAVGDRAFVCGMDNIAESESSIATGYGSKARLQGQRVHSSYKTSATGAIQASNIVLNALTTNAAPAEMKLNYAGGASGRLLLENDTSYLFKGLVLGRDGNTLSVGYEIKGLIARGASAALTQIIGLVTVSTISDLSGGCMVDAQADTVNGSLQIMVTGEAGKTYKWVCSLDWVEIK